jgi:serralysin
MSYRSYPGGSIGAGGGYTNETWGYPQTLMMYDIAALQRMYGADFTLNSGNTTYGWSPSTGAFTINGAVQWTPGANRVFMTVWDGGGTDTYDFSNYTTGVTIDLRPGEWTTSSPIQLANLGDGQMARGNVANALMFEGDTRSLIENAIGGSSSDRLTGGAGQDWFIFHSVADSRAGSADTITDFVRGSDKIMLESIDANINTEWNDAFRFVGTAAFSEAGDLRYETRADGVHVFGDVDGDLIADFEIIVTGQTMVGNLDFFF